MAGFQLFEGDQERLGVGNALKAWGYSAFNASEMGPSNKVVGEYDLKSAHPEPYRLGQFFPYELPRPGVEKTIVFKVQYVPGADDLTGSLVTIPIWGRWGDGKKINSNPTRPS